MRRKVHLRDNNCYFGITLGRISIINSNLLYFKQNCNADKVKKFQIYGIFGSRVIQKRKVSLRRKVREEQIRVKQLYNKGIEKVNKHKKRSKKHFFK